MKSRIEAIVKRLDERGQQQLLMPTSAWDPEVEAQICALDWHGYEGEPAIIALMAGLHLRNDSLDTSHSYAQRIEYDSTSAYWHGIMHRMEGDFSNGKYWFYKAGDHPAMKEAARQISFALRDGFDPMDEMPERIRQMLLDFRDNTGWNPSAFTDLVQWQKGQGIQPALRRVLEHIQYIETSTLFNYTSEASAPIVDRISDDVGGG